MFYQVTDAEKKLKDWRSTINELYGKYDELLFFGVSKILLIFKILTKSFSVDKVLQEIGFLFKRDDEAIRILTEAVKVCMHMYICSCNTLTIYMNYINV